MRRGPPRLVVSDPSALPGRHPETTLNYQQLLSVCGTATNAFLNLARSNGLSARRLLLLTPDGKAKHVVAEVLIDGRWVVADPAYRILLRDANGRLLTREDLRNPAVLAEATRAVPNYPKDYTYEKFAHVRLTRLPMQGFHLRWILDKVLPGWEERRVVVVIFNGELHNYRELLERLALSGHRFATQSDTEILVHAWEEWGEDCLEELRGMFALALLDLRKRYAPAPLLFLARDPLGIKPLYYTQTADGFAFASEIRALIAGGVAPKTLSPDALTSYFLFGSVSEPVTLLDGVFSLPPGHRMLLYVPERRRTPRAQAWWDATRNPSSKEARTTPDFYSAAKGLRPLLEDAVRAHLIADVPVGLFLSSGLDSSAIAALAARARAGICSFTLSFPGTAYDEAPLARSVAKHCGTQHREVPLGGEAVVSRLEEAVASLDQPSMDGINTYFVSWAAQEAGLKVALSGLGGDELFGGYATFSDTPRIKGVIRMAWVLTAPPRKAIAPLLRAVIAGRSSPDAARKAMSAWLSPDALPHPYFFTRALFPPGAELSRLIEPRFRPSTVGADGVTLEPTWLGWLARAADGAPKLTRNGGGLWLEMRCFMASPLLRATDLARTSR